MTARATIVVTGTVQGVYFRHFTKQKADEFGLAGTVRNPPDGTVKIRGEGEEKAVRALLEWCHHGSRGAHVETGGRGMGNPSQAFSGLFHPAY